MSWTPPSFNNVKRYFVMVRRIFFFISLRALPHVWSFSLFFFSFPSPNIHDLHELRCLSQNDDGFCKTFQSFCFFERILFYFWWKERINLSRRRVERALRFLFSPSFNRNRKMKWNRRYLSIDYCGILFFFWILWNVLNSLFFCNLFKKSFWMMMMMKRVMMFIV